MAVAKTKSDVVADMRANTVSLDSSINTEVGSVFRDVFMDITAEEFDDLYKEINFVSEKQSIANPERLKLTDVTSYGENWGVIRKPGTKATVIVYFRTSQEPTVDIRIDAGIIVSTVADTANNIDAIQFRTIEAKLLPFNRRDSYYNGTDGVWEITVSCQAVIVGAGSNVGAEQIKVLVDTISGIDEIINKGPSSGGTSQEAKAILAQRIIDSYVGGDRGIATGILSAAEGLTGVEAAIVITPGDSDMVRNGLLGNAVDIIIRGQQVVTFTESYIHSLSSAAHVFKQQPVLAISSVIDSNGITYTEDTDFSLVKDTSAFAGSRGGKDNLAFVSGREPAEDAIVSIIYTYNKLIKVVQEEFQKANNDIVNLDPLAREVTIINLVMDIKVKLNTGFEAEGVLPILEQAVTDYYNTLPLGSDAERSDAITLIQGYEIGGTAAIDKIFLPLTEFRKTTEVVGTEGDISVTSMEHVKVFSVSIHE